jgi:hypothetical protein
MGKRSRSTQHEHQRLKAEEEELGAKLAVRRRKWKKEGRKGKQNVMKIFQTYSIGCTKIFAFLSIKNMLSFRFSM